MTQPTDRDDDFVLAGEYVLHLLDTDARRGFEVRLAREPDLRALVRQWEENFAALTEGVEPVAAPPRLKADIEHRVFGAGARARPRRRLGLGLLAGIAAAAAIAAAVLVVLPEREGPVPSFVAEVGAEDGSLLIVARYDPADEVLTVERRAGGAGAGRSLQLWLIAEGAEAPVSLGVLSDQAQSAFALDRDRAAALAGATLAVSDEPAGGSPTGLPTGAVLAAGPVTRP